MKKNYAGDIVHMKNNHSDSTYILLTAHYRRARFIVRFFSFNLFGSISGFLQDGDAIKRMNRE